MLDITKNIAASIFIEPCDFDQLVERDFLKNVPQDIVWSLIQILKKRGAIIGDPDDGMKVTKKWAKEHLHEYDLDFRTPKQKWLDSLSPFKMDLYKAGILKYNPH